MNTNCPTDIRKTLRRYLIGGAIVAIWGWCTQGLLAGVLGALIGCILFFQLILLFRLSILTGVLPLPPILWLVLQFVAFHMGIAYVGGEELMIRTARVYGPIWDCLNWLSWGQVLWYGGFFGFCWGIYIALKQR